MRRRVVLFDRAEPPAPVRRNRMQPPSFRPIRWLKSPHLQTIGPTAPFFLRPPREAIVDQEELRFPLGERRDEGLLHARAWWSSSRAPAVVVLHGIAGSKDSYCCVRAAVALHGAGYHAVRVDMRGAGDSVVDAPSLYHAGLSRDLDLVLRKLAEHPRVSSVFVLGFSGGGSLALKLAGEWGDAPPGAVRGIASVSAPLDYTRVSPHMDKLGTFPYRFHVLRGLIDRARAFAVHHPSRAHYRARDLTLVTKFREYDRRIIVPMHGFDDVDDYYRDASSGPWLRRIRVPTLLVHAEDDPMVSFDTVRPWLVDASSSVEARLTREGGHIGWLAGLDESSWIRAWPTREALAFFARHDQR